MGYKRVGGGVKMRKNYTGNLMRFFEMREFDFIPALAFILGLIAAYLFFRQQISAIEGRARNDLEPWKLECTNDIRKDSVNRSRSTLKRQTRKARCCRNIRLHVTPGFIRESEAEQAKHIIRRCAYFRIILLDIRKVHEVLPLLPLCCFMIFPPSGVIIFLCCAVRANLSLYL